MKSLIFALLAAGWAGIALAQSAGLADPTRPAGSISPAGAGESEEIGLRLQSVLKSGDGATAIIGGKVVRLGDRVGEARLVRLSETEAVLRGPQGVERLFLVPDVSKKEARPDAAAKQKRKNP